MTSLTPRRPRSASELRKLFQNGLGRADGDAKNLAPAIGVHGHGIIVAVETMRPASRAFTQVASIHRYGHSPSIGRPRKAFSVSSISATRRLTGFSRRQTPHQRGLSARDLPRAVAPGMAGYFWHRRRPDLPQGQACRHNRRESAQSERRSANPVPASRRRGRERHAHGAGDAPWHAGGFRHTAYANGVSDEEIMGHTRYKSLTTMRGYVRRPKLGKSSPSGKLGL